MGKGGKEINRGEEIEGTVVNSTPLDLYEIPSLARLFGLDRLLG